jgi:hypothetical protein
MSQPSVRPHISAYADLSAWEARTARTEVAILPAGIDMRMSIHVVEIEQPPRPAGRGDTAASEHGQSLDRSASVRRG